MADDASAHPDVLNATAQGQLKSIIERVERLEVEKGEIAEQIKEVFAEAKGNGFDVKIIRKVCRWSRCCGLGNRTMTGKRVTCCCTMDCGSILWTVPWNGRLG